MSVEQRRQILEAIVWNVKKFNEEREKGFPGYTLVNKVADAFGRKEETVRGYLKELVSQGRLVNKGDGLWTE